MRCCFCGGRNGSVHFGPGHQYCVLIDDGVCLTAFWRQVKLPGEWDRTGTEQGRAGCGLRTEQEAGEVCSDSI